MLADPILAIENIQTTMQGYIKDVNDYYALLTQYKEKLAEARAEMEKIQKEKGDAAKWDYAIKVVNPLTYQTFDLGVNLRFSALAALSLRRYIGGRLYVMLKASFISKRQDGTYSKFLSDFTDLLASFEKSIVPYLVTADI